MVQKIPFNFLHLKCIYFTVVSLVKAFEISFTQIHTTLKIVFSITYTNYLFKAINIDAKSIHQV